MQRYFKAITRLFGRPWLYNIGFSGSRLRRAGEEELKEQLDADLHEEPEAPLPGADLSEAERREAVRQYNRELQEKGRR